jgi:hypothetical protein
LFAALVTCVVGCSLTVLWLRRSFLAGHALYTCVLTLVRASQLIGLSRPAPQPSLASGSLAGAQRVLGLDVGLVAAADERAAAAIARGENSSWWWFGQPAWCSVERSNRAGVAWWDVRANGVLAVAPAALWLDGIYMPAAPPHIGCHWSAALNMRVVVPELSVERSASSQLVMQLHRVLRRLFSEAGAAKTALLATTPDSSWLALTSLLRSTKSDAEMPAAIVLVSPLVDLDLNAHDSHRFTPLTGDSMTAARLERLASKILGLPTTVDATLQPSASALHGLSPSWQALTGLPPTMLVWDRSELLSNQIDGLLRRLRGSEVPVMEQARRGVGFGWLRLAPWSTAEGRYDMTAISRFLVQNGVIR